MILSEIEKKITLEDFSPEEPYIYSTLPGSFTVADFWIDDLGGPDYSSTQRVNVISFTRGFDTQYALTTSYNDMKAQAGSFYWDDDAQILYIHFEHDQEGWTDTYQYGITFGVTDGDIVYIDDIEYLPLILSAPSVRIQQDIINYDKLAFINGTLSVANTDAILDEFITENVYGNNVFTYYLDEDDISEIGNASRADLVRQGAFYIEDYDISLVAIDFRLQDIRKAQDIDIPIDIFSIDDYPDIEDNIAGDVIPLMYGQVREAKGYPTNGETTSGNVSYRAALLLTAIGTVQVDIEDIWTTAIPDSIDLTTGEFELLSADGRNSNGTVRACRLLLPTGIAITYISDIILDLNDRYLGVPFTDSAYDTTEWAAEETDLSSGGWVFDKQIKLFNAIKLVQQGSIVGFRYEIKPDGRRTIRIDDPTRTSIGRVEPVDIQNRDIMPVTTDSEQVFGSVKISYNKSFNSDRFQSVTNDDFRQQVLEDYNSRAENPSDTMLNNSTNADARALTDATRFSIIPSIVNLNLMGKAFLTLRIFDILDLELTPGIADADNNSIIGREYYGFQTGKVVGVNPKDNINVVSFQLV